MSKKMLAMKMCTSWTRQTGARGHSSSGAELPHDHTICPRQWWHWSPQSTSSTNTQILYWTSTVLADQSWCQAPFWTRVCSPSMCPPMFDCFGLRWTTCSDSCGRARRDTKSRRMCFLPWVCLASFQLVHKFCCQRRTNCKTKHLLVNSLSF